MSSACPTYRSHFLGFWVVVMAMLLACSSTAPENAAPQGVTSAPTPKINIGVADFVLPDDASSAVKRVEDRIVLGEGQHTLLFETLVDLPGRYQVDLTAVSAASGRKAWIEDYVGNPDARTYSITGEMALPHGLDGVARQTSKTGSPLNSGTHPMALHIEGPAVLESIAFTLLKKHRPSTDLRVQSMAGDREVLVWADEFDIAGLPDSTRWTYDVGDWGWGNNELQFYTEGKQENARIEDGVLIIQAHRDETVPGGWTSARLTTRGKVAFTYGKIEIRAQLPSGRGNWSAGWTLGNDYVDELSWPYCGEIDILESVGYQMDDETGDGIAHASVHSGAYYFKLGNQPTATLPVERMDREFHTYSIEWTPSSITAFVDGHAYLTYSDTSSALSWPFDRPQNLILNLTMGGGWGGLEGMDSTLTQQIMLIDYVRVYEKRQ